MKNFFKGLIALTLALIIFPAVPWFIGISSPDSETVEAAAEANVPKEPEKTLYSLTEVSVYDTVRGREKIININDYVAGTVAAQLAGDCPRELLKAQSVVMYTYILRRHLDEIENATPGLMGCDVSDDTNKYPRVLSDGTDGVDLDIYKEVAKEVEGEYISYGGEPITVAYCRSAGSCTESALTVLGVDVPYLQSVPSEEPDNYHTTVIYSSDEVFARISTANDAYILLGNPEDWIKISKAESNGYVSEVTLDSTYKVLGIEFAKMLNLPSARFTFRYSQASDRFTFTVSGSGSLVGLSQRGAAVMAGEGYNYREIIAHYFKDVKIEGAEQLSAAPQS